MFFWLVLRFLFLSLAEGIAWAVYMGANLILYIVFNFFFSIDSVLVITILIAGMFIIPYLIVAAFMVSQYFYNIRSSPIKYWWFFFKPIRDYDLKVDFPSELDELDKLQWLKDNLNREDYLLFSDQLYFKNKNDAVLYRLSIDG